MQSAWELFVKRTEHVGRVHVNHPSMPCLDGFLKQYKSISETSAAILKNQFCSTDDVETEVSRGATDKRSSVVTPLRLHVYQEIAVQWLILRFQLKLSCLIADEMGLGKTVQILAFLNQILSCHSAKEFNTNEAANSKRKVALIICPLSVVGVWQQEISRFFSHLRCRRWVTPEDRTLPLNIESNENQSFDILVTSYEVVLAEITIVSAIPWLCLILDEAHRIKNYQSVTYNKLLKHFESLFRVLLTGTPVQNSYEVLILVSRVFFLNTFNVRRD